MIVSAYYFALDVHVLNVGKNSYNTELFKQLHNRRCKKRNASF